MGDGVKRTCLGERPDEMEVADVCAGRGKRREDAIEGLLDRLVSLVTFRRWRVRLNDNPPETKRARCIEDERMVVSVSTAGVDVEMSISVDGGWRMRRDEMNLAAGV